MAAKKASRTSNGCGNAAASPSMDQDSAIDAIARLLVEMVVEQQTGRPCPKLDPIMPCHAPSEVAG
jgi:hypothetical protein